MCDHEWIDSRMFSIKCNIPNTGIVFVPIEHCTKCGVMRLPMVARQVAGPEDARWAFAEYPPRDNR